MDENQVRELAKSQGFSDDQIESAIEKEKLENASFNNLGKKDDNQKDPELSSQRLQN